MKKLFIRILILTFILQLNIVTAQQEQPPATGNVSKPIELPNFIIEGKEQLDVRTGTKQAPEKPSVMTKEQLDSLNSFEKQQSQLLPPEPLPLKVMNTEYKRGYLRAGLGRFAIADFVLGYGLEYKQYSFFGNTGFNHSGGHVNNSDYNKFFLNLNNDYIAPDKFFIFGGSKTRTNFSFKNSSYKLYASEIPPERNLMDLSLGIQSDGSYQGFIFSTGANFQTNQLEHKFKDSIKSIVPNNLLQGNLMIKNTGHQYEVGGRGRLDIELLRGQSAHFFELTAFGTYSLSKITMNLEAGFQSGSSSNKIVRAGFLLKGDINYNMSSLFTIKANFFTGLTKIQFNDLIEINPYISRFANIDYTYDMPSIKTFIFYHPNEEMSYSAGLKIGSKDRTPIFDSLENGALTLLYKQVNYLALESEGYWEISPVDLAMANMEINFSTLSDNGNFAPYVPAFKMSLNYARKFPQYNFGTNFGLVYFGKRYADIENKIELDGFIDMRIKVDYLVFDNFTVNACLENLFNSDIYIWQGYKEKGIYFGLGLNYNF